MLFYNLVLISFVQSQNINLDILLKNLTAQPIAFRSVVGKDLGFEFIETKTYEEGTIAEDFFKVGNISLQKMYGLYTIVAAKGEGLQYIFLENKTRLKRHLDDWNNNQESLSSLVTFSNVSDLLAQKIKADAIVMGAVEVHPCAVPVLAQE